MKDASQNAAHRSVDARELLYRGLGHENDENWPAAIACYEEVVEAENCDTEIRYFGYNNMAYSLVQLGRYDEAEPNCLAAIAINPRQYNAYKNFGLARQGQGRLFEAVLCFMTAHLLSSDPRAWHLLQAIITAHPEMVTQSEYLSGLLADMTPPPSENENTLS